MLWAHTKSFTYWNQWDCEILGINGFPERKWSPCYTSISHIQDMVDVLPSSMWYLMWWASTPFAGGRAWSRRAKENAGIRTGNWGPERHTVTLTISRHHWSLCKNTMGLIILKWLEINSDFIHKTNRNINHLISVCVFYVSTRYFRLSNVVRPEIFPEPAFSHRDRVLFVCFVFVSVCVWLKQTDLLRGLDEMGAGASINTASMEAHGLSDPPVNFQGGCRGHRRGQRSPFILITNNALLCPQHREKRITTGCSHEPACITRTMLLS